MIRTLLGLSLLSLALGACEQQPIPGTEMTGALEMPAEVCSQTGEELKKIGDSGGLTFGAAGEATVTEEVWLQLPQGDRDQLQKLLAYDAACKAKAPSGEQTVTIRNEWGRVMAQQSVETSADPSKLMGR
jgi:hypothetical protein